MKYEGNLRSWGELSEEERLAFPLLYIWYYKYTQHISTLKIRHGSTLTDLLSELNSEKFSVPTGSGDPLAFCEIADLDFTTAAFLKKRGRKAVGGVPFHHGNRPNCWNFFNRSKSNRKTARFFFSRNADKQKLK